MGAVSSVMAMVSAKIGRLTEPTVPGGAPAAGTKRNASTEGSANIASHCVSGGMCSAKTTRLAGFEIGSTKLAALAMKAQIRR